MNKFMIGGRGGSGKSEVSSELRNRSLSVIDSDDFPGLVRAEDLATGEPVTVDWSQYVDFTKIGWNWQPAVLKSILASKKIIYLCGSASNDLEFAPLFDKFFVLTLDPNTQRQRLAERGSAYGKDERQREEIILEQAEFVEKAIHLGAIAIDNNRPIKTVVDEILRIANETQSSS
jgi:dephospho-CoA kinase